MGESAVAISALTTDSNSLSDLESIVKNLKPGHNPVLYCTTKAIENPVGDGRHNRAPYRSDLEKNTIPAGFVFALDEEGNIEDRSRPFEVVPAAKGALLREALMAVATEPLQGPPPAPEEETVDAVLATLPASKDVTTLVLKALGLNGAQLRALLQAGVSAQEARQ